MSSFSLLFSFHFYLKFFYFLWSEEGFPNFIFSRVACSLPVSNIVLDQFGMYLAFSLLFSFFFQFLHLRNKLCVRNEGIGQVILFSIQGNFTCHTTVILTPIAGPQFSFLLVNAWVFATWCLSSIISFDVQIPMSFAGSPGMSLG